MATYATLSTEEKAILDAHMDLLRAWAGEQARVNNHGDVVNTDYNAQASAIIASLDAGTTIPNASGLVGAASLTKEEAISIVAHIQGILANYNTTGHRQLWDQAAGAANLIG